LYEEKIGLEKLEDTKLDELEKHFYSYIDDIKNIKA